MSFLNKEVSAATPTIVGTGLVALDWIVQREKDKYEFLYTAVGGTCGNVLTILSYFGWDAYPIARFGTDSCSQKALNELKSWGVKLDFIFENSKDFIPIIVEKINTNKAPYHSFTFKCPTCNGFLPSFKPVTLDRLPKITEELSRLEPSVFFFDRLSPAIIKLAEFFSKKRNTLIFFEPQKLDESKLMRKAFELSHIVKFSSQRNARSLKKFDFYMRELVDLVIITLGNEGLKFRFNLESNNWHYLSAYNHDSIFDTAGAGDWCSAGIIHHLAKKGYSSFFENDLNSISQSLDYGQILAALNCFYYGARGLMFNLSSEQLFSLIEQTSQMKKINFYPKERKIPQINVEPIIHCL